MGSEVKIDLPKSERVNRILDLTMDGLSHPEIQRALGREANVAGLNFEKSVKTILEELLEVRGVTLTPRNTKEVDLLVHVDPYPSKFLGQLNYVEVQVKKSLRGLRDYRRTLQQRYHLKSGELNGWLLRNRRILLVQHRSEQEVIRYFQRQLQDIKAYHHTI